MNPVSEDIEPAIPQGIKAKLSERKENSRHVLTSDNQLDYVAAKSFAPRNDMNRRSAKKQKNLRFFGFHPKNAT